MMFRNWMQIQNCVCVRTHTHIYIYIHIHTWKENERDEYSREIPILELGHLLSCLMV